MTGAEGPVVPVRALPVAAALVDGDGRVVDASRPFADLVGRAPSSLSGSRLADLVAPDRRAEVAAAWGSAEPGEVVVAGRRDDGLPFVATWSAPGGDPATPRLLVARRWGPPIRTPEATGGERDDEGRDVVDAALSHDVRGALRGAAGFLSVLARHADGWTDEARGYLETARRSTATADQMVERLVEYVRLAQRPLVVEPVDLGEIVDDAVRQVDDAGSSPAVEVEVSTLPSVVGDRTHLVVLFAELLTNAGRFGATSVRISAADVEHWTDVRVDDDGPGIDEELRARAFDLFRMLQPKGRHPGVGAGLALARRIAEVHGGRCMLDAGEGGGTAVVARLLRA